jgi:Holliday junction resolvasome RuvABC ATP-dependent DNA helicase subunit
MSDTKIQKWFPNLFSGIVGQESAKRRVLYELDCSLHTRVFGNKIFTAAKGQGKTTIARETAKGLIMFDLDGKMVMEPDPKDAKKERPKRKTFVEVNAATIKNLKAFINSVIVPHVADKDVTLFIDEVHNLPKDVTNAMLTILNPNDDKRTTFSHEEYVCDFDFRRQTFLFATSEPHLIFDPLLDRLERIDLQDYTFDDLAKIVRKGAKEIEFEEAALNQIATVLRGNARAARMMADKVEQFLRGKTKFTSKHWKELCNVYGILPLGLNATELQILRLLSETTDGTSLTKLAAQTGLSREALQKDYEMYLQKHGLMEISTTGRIITAKGLEYLKAMDKQACSK